MKSILDRSFRYTSSVETDLHKTFAKLQRQQREAQKVPVDATVSTNVLVIKRQSAR